jgi:hypothetical protein
MDNNQPPIQCSINIYNEDSGIRLNIPISVQDADELFKQIKSNAYEGQIKIWLTGSFAFKTEEERTEFYKTKNIQ